MELYALWLIASGLVTFVLYAVDKKRAKKNQWRIKEATLLGASMIGGFIGGLAGMYLCRHKTKHWYFVAVNFLALIVWLAIGYFVATEIGLLFI